MKQYCRYCRYADRGLTWFCFAHFDGISETKATHPNRCEDFRFRQTAVDVDGLTYQPRKVRRRRTNYDQISLPQQGDAQMQKIRIITKKPHEPPELRWADNSLRAFQIIIGGYIKTVPLPEVPGTVLICNEEGKIRGLENNIDISADTIVGPVAVVGDDGEEFRSLTEEELSAAIDILTRADADHTEGAAENEE